MAGSTTSGPFDQGFPPIQTHTSLTHRSNGLRNEEGHALCRIQPMSKHSGESVSTFFNGFFSTILAVATLGTSITFSYVLSNNAPPPASANHDPRFSQASVQLFLSISWLLFLLAMAFASLASTLLTFFKDHWKADWDGRNGHKSQHTVQIYASISTGAFGGLLIAAFVFLCLVIIAYSPIIGWIALGFTMGFGAIIMASVLWQAPWSWRGDAGLLPKRAATA